MSNQVYANQVKKYSLFTGVNTYERSGSQAVLKGDTGIVDFNSPGIVTDSPLLWEIAGGVITINQDCFISVNSFIKLAVNTSPATNHLNTVVVLLLTRPGVFTDLVLDENKDVGKTDVYLDYTRQVSFAGVVQNGDQISVAVSCPPAGDDINILNGSRINISGF